MPALPLATAYADRSDYGEPQRQVNLYVEAGPGKPSRRPRPGLVLRYRLGTGPMRASLYTEGVVGPAVYSISGGEAYRGETLIGVMIGSAGATIASSGDEVVFTLGGLAYLWNGSTFAQITDPDLPAVSAVRFMGGRFYYQVQDSDQWYFSAIYDAGTIDGLAFATAESSPDATVGMMSLGDEEWFFGSQSVEPWYQTGDASAPLQRAQGRRFERGCASALTICALDNTLFWLGDNGQAYRAAERPKRVSTNPIEALIRKAGPANCSAFTTTFDGHEFYVLKIPGYGDFALDAATGQWAEWQTYGAANFAILTCSQVEAEAYLGDADGNVYEWGFTTYADNGLPITRICAAFLPIQGGVAPNTNVCLHALTGVAPVLGQGSEPLVEMRYSDNGKTWSDWIEESLGVQGDFDQKAIWRRLGQIGSPGRWYEFRTTDPLIFSPAGMTYNEQRP